MKANCRHGDLGASACTLFPLARGSYVRNSMIERIAITKHRKQKDSGVRYFMIGYLPGRFGAVSFPGIASIPYDERLM